MNKFEDPTKDPENGNGEEQKKETEDEKELRERTQKGLEDSSTSEAEMREPLHDLLDPNRPTDDDEEIN